MTLAEEHDNGNILVNFNDLKSLIEPNLGTCPICKTSGLELQKVLVSGISTGLNLFCKACLISEQKNKREIHTLKEKAGISFGKERKKIIRQVTAIEKKRTVAKQKYMRTCQLRLRTSKYSGVNTYVTNALQYEINKRLYTTAYIGGAGYKKTATLLAALNFGTKNSERGFYRHQHTICRAIRSVTKDVIK